MEKKKQPTVKIINKSEAKKLKQSLSSHINKIVNK